MPIFTGTPFGRQLLFSQLSAHQGARSTRKPIVIGWGRQDLVGFASQAARTMELFPTAKLHLFDDCGHFPQWDHPSETARLILATTG